ncbi:hypothetical protein PMAYCL1PPCAC_28135, partial [Pristionchus mayeri]
RAVPLSRLPLLTPTRLTMTPSRLALQNSSNVTPRRRDNFNTCPYVPLPPLDNSCNCEMCDNYRFFQSQNNDPGSSTRRNSSENAHLSPLMPRGRREVQQVVEESPRERIAAQCNCGNFVSNSDTSSSSSNENGQVAQPIPAPSIPILTPNRSMFGAISSSSEESIPAPDPASRGIETGAQFTLAPPCEDCSYISTMFNEGSCYCCSSSSEENVVVFPLPLFEEMGASDEELELSMQLFAAWTEENEEAVAEPDTHDSLLMAALLSSKEESSEASADLRTTSCPNLMFNLPISRRVHFEQQALAIIPEETPSCSCCSISTSNLFSDRANLPSSISVTGSAIVPYISSASSLAIDASEVSSTASSLFKDPSSAHSSSSSSS